MPISQQCQFTWSFRALTQAKHMVPFYPIWISNTQFDWRDCQMMTGRGHFINTVFSSSMYLLTPLNSLASLSHLIFQATSKRPNCLGRGCDLSLFPCICAQATNRSQNCFSRCVFSALLMHVQTRGGSFPALAGWFPNHTSIPDQLGALMFSLLQVSK